MATFHALALLAASCRLSPVPPAGESAAFPLAVSSDKRYLVDQNGTPFRLQGDSAWSLIANLTAGEIDTYLADRASRGFNALLVNLLEHRFAELAPRDLAGDYPFTSHTPGSYDFSTPNEAYFAFADQAIDKAAAKGFVVFLNVMYCGYGGGEEGWWSELTNATNTRATCYAYGQFLGNRYKDKPNLVFVLSGDYTPPAGSEGEARLLEIRRGIREAGAAQLMTAHIAPGGSSSDWSAFAGFDELYGIYPGDPPTNCYTLSLQQYAAGGKPVYLLEPGYEAEGWYEPGTPAAIRRYAWWAQLSGIAGTFYGHRDIWAFQTDSWNAGYPFGYQDWRQSLGAPGAVDMSRMSSLLDSLEWWRLVPSGLAGMKTLVTAGLGSGNEHVAAAAAADGSFLLAYVPTAHTGAFTIDLTALAGGVTAYWWDPTNGASTPLGSLTNTGTHDFSVPGSNAGGDGDWLLVLTSP